MMETIYPIEMEMKMAITNEDGSNTGTITYGFGGGRAPTQEEVAKSFDEAIEHLPYGYRSMTRHEHFLYRVQQRTGQLMRLAVPDLEEGKQWHNPEAANTFCNWGHDFDPDFEEDE